MNCHDRGIKLAVLLLGLSLTAMLAHGASYGITVNTDFASYQPGDTVVVTGNVTVAGNGASDESVGVQVNAPDGDVLYIDQTSTGNDGSYSVVFSLPQESETGTYQVYASHSQASATTDFSVTTETSEGDSGGSGGDSSGGSGGGSSSGGDSSGGGGGISFGGDDSSETDSGGGTGDSDTHPSDNNTNTATDADDTTDDSSDELIEKFRQFENVSNDTASTEQQINEIRSDLDNLQNAMSSNTLQSITGAMRSSTTTYPLLVLYLIAAGFVTFYRQQRMHGQSSRPALRRKGARVVFLIFFVIMSAQFVMAAEHVSVSRSVPEHVSPGQSVTIELAVDVNENNTPQSFIVSEQPPEAVSITDSGDGTYDAESNVIKWLFVDIGQYLPVEDTTLSYTVQAPQSSQTVAFNGVVNQGENTSSIAGDTVLTIGCIEQWECGEWSQCTDGVQKRTCVDANSCGTTERKPITRRSCADTGTNVTEDTQEPQDVVNDTQDSIGNETDAEQGTDTVTENVTDTGDTPAKDTDQENQTEGTNTTIGKQNATQTDAGEKTGAHADTDTVSSTQQPTGSVIASPSVINGVLAVLLGIYMLIAVYERSQVQRHYASSQPQRQTVRVMY